MKIKRIYTKYRSNVQYKYFEFSYNLFPINFFWLKFFYSLKMQYDFNTKKILVVSFILYSNSIDSMFFRKTSRIANFTQDALQVDTVPAKQFSRELGSGCHCNWNCVVGVLCIMLLHFSIHLLLFYAYFSFDFVFWISFL